MPDPYNPWATPIFPSASAFGVGSPAETAERQPTIVDNLLSHIAGALGRGFMAPGQALQSTTPITSEQMIAPAQDMSTMMSAGSAPFPGSANELRMGIKAYHGSPHDFERFDLSKIGTGEGAQAYGHGLYFAEAEPVAKGYRDALAKDMYYTPSGQMFDPQSQLQHMNVRVAARNNGSDLDATIARARELLPKASDQARPMLENDLKVLQSFKDAGGVSKNPGHMYEVNINADPAHFLDWDKPLNQQSSQVQAAFAHEAPTEIGSEAFHKLQNALIENRIMPNAPTDVPLQHLQAQHLREAGIPGIKYLDQGSRGAGQGSSNYVVFNDKLIDILRKYAVPGMMGAPIFANSIGEQKS